MNKSDTVNSITSIINHHKKQMSDIEILLSGKMIDEPTVISKTESEFGLWFYSRENHIKEILGSQFYDKLDYLHSSWHEQYFKIYKIFFSDEKRGFFSKILTSNKVDLKQIDKAKLYYSELKSISDDLLKALGSSLRRASALSETKFDID